jgi:hypothetical protein
MTPGDSFPGRENQAEFRRLVPFSEGYHPCRGLTSQSSLPR